MKYGDPKKARQAYLRSQQSLQKTPENQKTDLEKFLGSLTKAGLYELNQQSLKNSIPSDPILETNE